MKQLIWVLHIASLEVDSQGIKITGNWEGIKISVIDPFTVKPMDVNAVKKAVELSGGKLLTVEDHYAYVSINKAFWLDDNLFLIGWTSFSCIWSCLWAWLGCKSQMSCCPRSCKIWQSSWIDGVGQNRCCWNCSWCQIDALRILF